MAALNIVPLCRSHHTEYDGGRLELLPYLSKAERKQCVVPCGRYAFARALTTRQAKGDDWYFCGECGSGEPER